VAEGFGGLNELQGLVLQSAPAVAQPGLFGILGLQGIVVHASIAPAGAGFGIYSLTGVVIPNIGGPAAVAPQANRDCNWGSWCKRWVT
jgi:hypothetical protein